MTSPESFRVDGGQPSPHSIWNKLARVLWGVAYYGVFRWTPSFMHKPRVAILRVFGARVASDAHVYPSVSIWAPWNLELESGACLGPRVTCYNVAPIRLGRSATVSQNAHLCAASHDYRDPRLPLTTAPIVIEEGAWVCADAFVSMGVRIGRNTVVGARAVVTKDMPDNMVCAGHPCRPIKARVQNAKRT